MRFTYQTGARPLAGYTIQRGIHRGGFGEVYFANSEGGKEVALKLLHREDRDVEIRGVTQCLNLKHPNLVNLFDLKTDEHGDHWVVMEYVGGSSLEDVLETFPDGLPLNEVRDWLNGLVAGVAHLHDRGIVHRDLKPANVYRENGVVKVGDVGLSKQLESDRRQHTQSVGTVYYMAPEVARGQYGPEVDVYSLGVMLYEMITGKLPFDGETTAEILMKHLTAQPDLTSIPAALRPTLARALEKDPLKRTPGVRQLEQEFMRASESVGPIVPTYVPKIPEPVKIPPIPPGSAAFESRPSSAQSPNQPRVKPVSAKRRPDLNLRVESRSWREWVPELANSMGSAAFVASILAAVCYGIQHANHVGLMPTSENAVTFTAISIVGSWMLLIGHSTISNTRLCPNHPWLFRVLIGMMIGAAAFALDQFLAADLPVTARTAKSAFQEVMQWKLTERNHNPTLAGYLVFFMTWLAFRNPFPNMHPLRKRRLNMGSTITSVIMAYLASIVFEFPQWYAMLWAGTITGTVQMASVWIPKLPDVNEAYSARAPE